MDIPQSSIKRYISGFKPQFREKIAVEICNGESFVNAFETPDVRVLFDVLSEQIDTEIRKMLALIRGGKYTDDEELRRVRQHCISINKVNDIIIGWKAKLDTLERHLNNLE